MLKRIVLGYLPGAGNAGQIDRLAKFNVLVLPRQSEYVNWATPAA
jgi:hypothetical protein